MDINEIDKIAEVSPFNSLIEIQHYFSRPYGNLLASNGSFVLLQPNCIICSPD